MKRAWITVVMMLVGCLTCSAQNTLFYFPQIADGTQTGAFWKTTIYLTNPGPVGSPAANGTITFLKTVSNASAAFNVQFVDGDGNPVGSGNTISFSIAGGQIRKFVSRGVTPLATGFATVASDGQVTGTAIFSLFRSDGQLISEAGVPAAAALTRQTIFVDTLNSFNTGVAYANPNGGPATITLQLLTLDGTPVRTSTTSSLPANGQNAVFVTQLFTNPAPPAFVGTMQITSTTPLAAVALRFDPTLTFFTTLPSVPLD